MTTHTKNDLRDAVLEDLRVKDAFSVPNDADNQLVQDAIAQVLEYLEMEALIAFDTTQSATTENIPANIFRALAGLVRLEVGPKFGQVLTLAEREAEELTLKRKLRRVVFAEIDDTPVKLGFF